MKFFTYKIILADIANIQIWKRQFYKTRTTQCYGKGRITDQFVFWLLNEFFQLLYSSQSSVSVVFPSNPPKKIWQSRLVRIRQRSLWKMQSFILSYSIYQQHLYCPICVCVKSVSHNSNLRKQKEILSV